MLIVLADTSTSAKRNARSVSARTSAAVFSNPG